MNKLVSILLFGLLTFNMLGFSVYTLVETNDSEKPGTGLEGLEMTLKFPVSIPYLNNWQDPEVADGELLHGDDYYKIVSRQIVNDTLYLKCKFSQNARERFWGLASDLDDHIKTSAGTEQENPGRLLKNFLKEYMTVGRMHTFFVLEWIDPVHYPSAYAWLSHAAETSIPSPPPDLA